MGMGFRLVRSGSRIASMDTWCERRARSFTCRSLFHLLRLERPRQYGVTREAAIAEFEAFAVAALKTVDMSRTDTKNWS